MKILFLTERFPHPLHDGGSLRSYHIIRTLAAQHAVTVLSQGEPEKRGGDRHYLDKTCQVRFVPSAQVVTQGIRNLLERGIGQSLLMLKNWSDPFFAAANEMLATGGFDVVHCNHLDTAWYALKADWKQHKVFDTHNCLSGLYQQVATDSRAYLRPIFRREAAALAALERDVTEAMDLVLVCSEEDKRQFRALSASTPIHVVGNGVDTSYFSPRNNNHEHAGGMVFTGNMGYFPNRDAMLWFHDEILPALRKRCQGSGIHPRIEIVGSNSRRGTQAIHDGTETVVVGPVPDVRPFIASAQAFVVPIRYGSGTRLKILDAMAMGKVVVSTTKGAEGLDLVPEKDLLLGDTAEEFAAQVARVLTDAELRQKIGAAARETAVQKHDWTISESRLREAYARFAE